MARIGLMGGSFNPIHSGHVHIARMALEGGHVDRVVFLPSGNPPHKRDGLADKEHRYRMTCLAIAGEENMAVSREEIDREGVIYTVDTLTHLRAQRPQDTFFYLIGADTVHQLHTWRRVETLIGLCGFLVMMRPGEDETKTLAAMDEWRKKGAQMTAMRGTLLDVSSSAIRAGLAAGGSAGALLPPAVLDYIRAHHLYGTGDQP